MASLKLLQQIALTYLPPYNNVQYLPFLKQLGGIEGFFSAPERDIEVLLKARVQRPNRSKALIAAEEELRVMDRFGINVCSVDDPLYPPLLRETPDAPIVLFYRGNAELRERRMLALIGTRNASEWTKQWIREVVEVVASIPNPPVIVSGLAYGIDITAHLAALQYGLKTVAVEGCSVSVIYPSAHYQYAERMLAAGGALFSEYPSGADIFPTNFLQRNRIVAGMSHGIVVAESPIKGGSISTAYQAQSYHREIMALAGRPSDQQSIGCNRLIKNNVAALVEDAHDILTQLNWEYRGKPENPVQPNLFQLSENETKVMTALKKAARMTPDEVSRISGLPIREVTIILVQLEMAEWVRALPGGQYEIG